MAWRKLQKGVDGNLWDHSGKCNRDFTDTLLLLNEMAASHTAQYQSVLSRLALVPSAKWDELASDDEITRTIIHFKNLSAECRGNLRNMGVAAGVEIEPPKLDSPPGRHACDAWCAGCGVPRRRGLRRRIRPRTIGRSVSLCRSHVGELQRPRSMSLAGSRRCSGDRLWNRVKN